MLDTIVFDVDGTLVDSSYLHLRAWTRAFSDVGVWVPTWRLHACMGMGGDHLVAAAAGDAVENAVGDEIRDRWRTGYGELIDEVRPLPDALAVLEACRRSGLAVVLATSGNQDHVGRTLEILGAGHDEYPVVNSADVASTKPAGDLVERALDVVHGNTAAMVGDTVWDVQAGDAVGVPVIGVLTGGVSRAALHDAGAMRVFADVAAVREALPDLLAVFGSSPVSTVR
ncbi:HAD family hydrolase [Nocardioides marmorisolisilvae]|nr:HAD family hydrolase [Nocardioides marmorisolisilvae]